MDKNDNVERFELLATTRKNAKLGYSQDYSMLILGYKSQRESGTSTLANPSLAMLISPCQALGEALLHIVLADYKT